MTGVESVAQEPTPPAPVDKPWTVTTVIQGVAPDTINRALAVYNSQGLSKTGAAYIIGNFMQEKRSAFITLDPCGGTLGDGGAAHGFGQWHPARRVDMPCGFDEQLIWAVNVEMPRDAGHNGYANLGDRLKTDNVDDIIYGIKQWERYGHEGSRFQYGAEILANIQ